MKCIKKDGVIRRVKDDEARNLVNSKNWNFIPKEEWKEAGRPTNLWQSLKLKDSYIEK